MAKPNRQLEASSYSLKKPFIYSETYRQWKTATISHGADSPQAIAMACHHAKLFRVTNKRCMG